MKRVLLLLIVFATAVACGDAPVTQPANDASLQPPSMEPKTDLITPAGFPVTVLGFGAANDINARGQVVGWSWNEAGEKIAVMWDGEAMIDLGTIANKDLEGLAINAKGQVAISQPRFWNGTDEERSTHFWERGEATLIADKTRVLGINNRGQVVGWETDVPDPLGFIWEDGQFTFLKVPPEYNTNRPFSVNEAGQIAGFSGGPITRAFVWDRKGIQPLPTPGGYVSRAYSINNLGDVVGAINPDGSNDQRTAVLWRDGVLIKLGTLGGDYASARDINARGQIVGWSLNGEGVTTAVMWDGDQIIDLGRPEGVDDLVPTDALAINSRGQIVGWGDPGDGSRRAYMWNPRH